MGVYVSRRNSQAERSDFRASSRNQRSLKTPIDSLAAMSNQKVAVFAPNHYEQQLLKKCWNNDFDDLYNVGSSIFTLIFTHAPDTLRLFPFLTGSKDWSQSRIFQKQSLKVAQVLAFAIKHLDKIDEIDPMLLKVGQAHKQYSERGFRPHHWTVFQIAIKKSVIKQIAKSQLTDEERGKVEVLWDDLALYIVQKLYEGFIKEEIEDLELDHRLLLNSP